MTEETTTRREESARRTLWVTLLVCLVCALVVSAAAVLLRPLRERRRREGQAAVVRAMLEQQPGIAELLRAEEGGVIEAHVVDLDRGVIDPELDAATFDARAAERDPTESVPIPPERDYARIERRTRHAPVYLVRRGSALEMVVLPIRGRGYASVIRGYLALAGDLDTVLGISFYEHGETPGIGAEIEDPDWRGQWVGKRVFDEAGAVRIRVVDPDAPLQGDPRYRVDGIGGATRSSQGVGNMVRFWVGEDGFGRFLRRLEDAR